MFLVTFGWQDEAFGMMNALILKLFLCPKRRIS